LLLEYTSSKHTRSLSTLNEENAEKVDDFSVEKLPGSSNKLTGEAGMSKRQRAPDGTLIDSRKKNRAKLEIFLT